jgi:U1 small nuclear ribonucleoprotein
LPFKPGLVKRKMPPYEAVAKYVEHFEDPAETPPAKPIETIAGRRARVREAKLAKHTAALDAAVEAYDPSADEKLKESDPYKTLFVARMSYETTEEGLKKAFEQFGQVKSVHLVRASGSNKPRGYGFIEFEHERDMKTAYKQGDGKKIDGRRVLVDVERGRTVRNWKPRRLGGGLGSTRVGGKSNGIKTSGRDFGSGMSSAGPPSSYAPARSNGPSHGPPSGGPAPSFSWSTETRTDDRGAHAERSSHRPGLGSGGDRGYGGSRGSDSHGDRYGDRGGDRYGDRGGDRYGDRGGDRYGDRGGDRYGDRGGGHSGGSGTRRYDERDYDRRGERDYDRRERRDERDRDRRRDRSGSRERDRDRDRRREREGDRSSRDRDRARREREKEAVPATAEGAATAGE